MELQKGKYLKQREKDPKYMATIYWAARKSDAMSWYRILTTSHLRRVFS